MNEKKPLTLKEFARRYGICTKTAGRWVRRYKDLEVMRIGKMFYIPLESLEAWEQNRQQDFQKVFRPKQIL